MTLRLRLTLINTLLVAMTLAFSGVGLHLLLAMGLYRNLDTNLQQSAALLSGFIEQDEGVAQLQPEGRLSSQFGNDLVAVLLAPDGRVLDSLGRVPKLTTSTMLGFSTQGVWRVWSEAAPGGVLLTLANTQSIVESIRRFDVSFLIMAPLAVTLAFTLGYFFAGRALRPVRQLTHAAFELAKRRAWRERLPEPSLKDELWHLSQATNTLLTALAEVIEGERRFTADAAHELRTPLTVLRGRLEQAVEKTHGSKAQPALATALNASDDLLELVKKLLLLTRMEAGQGLSIGLMPLNETALDVAKMLMPLFEEKGLKIELDFPALAVWVNGDKVALRLLTRNLLDNALKFTNSGTVGVQVKMGGGKAYMHVWDTGPGFPEHALAHLFERFYQADVRYRQFGSGLGLTLARSIAQWHGGELTATNRQEGGAKFTLELPLAVVPNK